METDALTNKTKVPRNSAMHSLTRAFLTLKALITAGVRSARSQDRCTVFSPFCLLPTSWAVIHVCVIRSGRCDSVVSHCLRP